MRRLLPLCLLLAAGLAAAQAYKWTDEHGKVHFSDTPPPDRKASKLDVRPSVPADPQATARSKSWQQQLEESNLRRNDQEKRDKADEQARRQQEQRCVAAQRSLDTLNRGRPVYRTDKSGERVYLEDTQRPAEIEAAKRRVEAECR